MLNEPLDFKKFAKDEKFKGLRIGLIGFSIGLAGGIISIIGWMTTGFWVAFVGVIIFFIGSGLNAAQVLKGIRGKSD